MGSGEIPVESQGKEMLVAWTRDGEEGADGIKFGRKEQRGVTKKLRVPVSLCVPGVSIHHAFTHSCLYLVSTYDQQQTKETKAPHLSELLPEDADNQHVQYGRSGGDLSSAPRQQRRCGRTEE